MYIYLFPLHISPNLYGTENPLDSQGLRFTDFLFSFLRFAMKWKKSNEELHYYFIAWKDILYMEDFLQDAKVLKVVCNMLSFRYVHNS